MPRAKQIVRQLEEKFRWFQDHKGEQFLSYWTDCPEENEPPTLSVQMYIAPSLDELQLHGSKLMRYLSYAISDSDSRLDIYRLGAKDVFDCVDHQRREIKYRQQLHSQTETLTSPLPLIPLDYSDEDREYSGSLIIIPDRDFGCDPFELGKNRTSDGPISVGFLCDRDAKPLQSALNDPTATLERNELNVVRYMLPRALLHSGTLSRYKWDTSGRRKVHVDSEEDYSALPDLETMLPLPDGVKTLLTQDKKGVSYMVAERGTGPFELQYIVYAPVFDPNVQFDHREVLHQLLSNFVSQISRHIPNETSFYFEMHFRPNIPNTTPLGRAKSLASILDHLKTWSLSQNLETGFLVPPSPRPDALTQSTRRVPTPNAPAETLRARTFKDYEYLAVVLERADFVQDGAVLTIMTEAFDLQSALGLPPSEAKFELSVARMPRWDYCVQRLAGLV